MIDTIDNGSKNILSHNSSLARISYIIFPILNHTMTQINGLRISIDYLQLLQSDVKLRSFEIFDNRLVSRYLTSDIYSLHSATSLLCNGFFYHFGVVIYFTIFCLYLRLFCIVITIHSSTNPFIHLFTQTHPPTHPPTHRDYVFRKIFCPVVEQDMDKSVAGWRHDAARKASQDGQEVGLLLNW